MEFKPETTLFANIPALLLIKPAVVLGALVLPLVLAPVALFYCLRHELRPRPLDGIPLLPGAFPLFGHSLELLRHVRGGQTAESWYVDAVERCGSPRLVQIMRSWNNP